MRFLGLQHRDASEQQRLAVEQARQRRELGPRRRQRAGADHERGPAERLGERLRDTEPRVNVLPVEPCEHRRTGGRDGSGELGREALLRGCEPDDDASRAASLRVVRPMRGCP